MKMSDFRSLEFRESWLEKKCKICEKNFYIVPSFSHIECCSSECSYKWRSLKIKDSKNTPKSKLKTSRQQIERWSDPENRKDYSKKIKLAWERNKGKWITPELRERWSENCRQAQSLRAESQRSKRVEFKSNCFICSKLIIKKVSISRYNYLNSCKHHFCSNKCQGIHVLRECCKEPNHSEQYLYSVLQEIFPNEFVYSGNGQIMIANKCPDFINEKRKIIIELYGEYWHKKSEEEERKAIFKKFGYDTLIIWTLELKNLELLKERIKDFVEEI